MKRLVIAISLLAIFLVSGCVGAQSETPTEGGGVLSNLFGKKTEVSYKPFVTGTDGLAFSFVKGEPPESALIAEQFPITFVVENRGAIDVPAGKLKLSMSNARVFGLGSTGAKTNSEKLAARQITGLAGSKEIIEIGEAKFAGIPPLAAESKAIVIDTCYPYKTKLAAELCAAARDGECDPAAQKSFYSSSAPVQFSEYKQISARKNADGMFDLSFSFKVRNAGTGTVYKNAGCSEGSELASIESVNFAGQQYFGEEKLSCFPDIYRDGIILSDDKEGRTMRCTLKGVPALTGFQEQLQITISYSYAEIIITNVVIIPTET